MVNGWFHVHRVEGTGDAQREQAGVGRGLGSKGFELLDGDLVVLIGSGEDLDRRAVIGNGQMLRPDAKNGALAGPLSFRAGAALGAVRFSDPALSLFALSVGWAVLMPLMLALARRWDGVHVPTD